MSTDQKESVAPALDNFRAATDAPKIFRLFWFPWPLLLIYYPVIPFQAFFKKLNNKSLCLCLCWLLTSW